jgi:hypothetical protein
MNNQKMYAVFFREVAVEGCLFEKRRLVDAKELEVFHGEDSVGFGRRDKSAFDKVEASSVSEAVRAHLSNDDTSPLRHSYSVYVFENGRARALREDFEHHAAGGVHVPMPVSAKSKRFAYGCNVEEALAYQDFGADGLPLSEQENAVRDRGESVPDVPLMPVGAG